MKLVHIDVIVHQVGIGSTCAKAVDYCLSQPCNRNGTCMNKVSLSLQKISSKKLNSIDKWI